MGGKDEYVLTASCLATSINFLLARQLAEIKTKIEISRAVSYQADIN